jgi:hypothetical protein
MEGTHMDSWDGWTSGEETGTFVEGMVEKMGEKVEDMRFKMLFNSFAV